VETIFNTSQFLKCLNYTGGIYYRVKDDWNMASEIEAVFRLMSFF